MDKIKAWGITGIVIPIFFVFSLFLFFHTGTQIVLRKFFSPQDRIVLSVATGRIFPDSGEGRVVKLMTPDGVVLEIYGPPENNLQPLVDRISLLDKRDGFFQFRGRATNLALKDMDNDTIFEIITPTYDSSLIPHLNIFRYNKDTLKFEPFTE